MFKPITLAIIATIATPALAIEHPFRVLGTWDTITLHGEYEAPFWTTTLPALTNNKVKGDITSVSQTKYQGYEVLDLLQSGDFDFGYAVVGYISAAFPIIEGIDLAGVSTDLTDARANADAYRAVVNAELAKQDLIMLAHYSFGPQFVFCKDEMDGLADLRGRRVRSSSATHADFLAGVGAVNVTLSFDKVLPAVRAGQADCAVTSAVAAYDADWASEFDYVYALPLNMSLSGLFANLSTWNGLESGVRNAMTDAVRAWESRVWTDYIAGEALGLACVTGGSGCSGEAVNMSLVSVSAADKAEASRVSRDDVMSGWLARCSAAGVECADTWEGSIGR